MLPCVYVFQYSKDKIEKALYRLRCSINSISTQTNNIYIVTDSNGPELTDSVYSIKDKYEISILYTSKFNVTFNKSRLLNFAIKNYLLKYDYCILADTDIIFSPDYIEKMEKYTHGEPCRVTGFNQGAAHEFYISDFNEAVKLINEHGVTSYRCGESVGIGLLHIPSFLKIRGFNEDFQEYAPEDCELNRRLSYINKHIYDPSIVNIHLYHEPNAANYTNENNKIYEESEKRFLAGDLIRNDENFGEY